MCRPVSKAAVPSLPRESAAAQSVHNNTGVNNDQMPLQTRALEFPCTPGLCRVTGPPVAGAFRERRSKPTAFRKFYERGDFPIALEHDTKGNRIAWKEGTASVAPPSPADWWRGRGKARPFESTRSRSAFRLRTMSNEKRGPRVPEQES
ncbi:hypothetical protein SKAU_G00178700 [Synaphobranchus kaupii]|uniref:Parkin coregulated gene protein n=1 Tax=Synaphobranchus kaupii TaxID=118154 RepID=A0A9Q1FLV8_SYNKA|nr:hypothetical protein SKAU_G00178700 [Synaphobranchus kaupii]